MEKARLNGTSEGEGNVERDMRRRRQRGQGLSIMVGASYDGNSEHCGMYAYREDVAYMPTYVLCIQIHGAVSYDKRRPITRLDRPP